jgi:hypothetical protein
VPVSPEAIESAVDMIEDRGFGRSRETFEFGRRLAVEPRLFSRPAPEGLEHVDRMARRMALSVGRAWWRGGRRARGLSRLIHESLLLMPGLAQSEAGRAAQRDFVMACHRCLTWGGLEYAQQFAQLISGLYRIDQDHPEPTLTLHAVLPLAEAMLIRDPLYIASMASSPEQRRRTRQRLNVKPARGDRIERRYLTRFELIGFNHRLRADVRTSDWPARAAALVRRLAPRRWRGTRRERDLRAYLIEFVMRAIDNAPRDFERWSEAMRRLHHQAAEDRLRGMALSEIRMLAEADASTRASGERTQDGRLQAEAT